MLGLNAQKIQKFLLLTSFHLDIQFFHRFNRKRVAIEDGQVDGEPRAKRTMSDLDFLITKQVSNLSEELNKAFEQKNSVANNLQI